MLDVLGPELTPEDRARLQHPMTGGVILFSRNYESLQQVTQLVHEIHALRRPKLLVAVDHEGGRVQRFRSGFTCLPPVSRLGEIHDENPKRARRMAELSGWLMASELRQVGIDFSFAPVLDLGLGMCEVIGNRAFHSDPEVVADLAHAYMHGMQRAGMAAVGKHFPGHGSVRGDSHLELPVDERDFEDISSLDLIPFERLVHYGIAGMMPAHVLYPRVDSYPAGFSRFWLQTVLRQQLGFEGLIFSDDLSMEGAVGMGGIAQRARLALGAGCDMVLVCNDPEASDRLLSGLKHEPDPAALARYAHMHGRSSVVVASRDDAAWREAVEAVSHYA